MSQPLEHLDVLMLIIYSKMTTLNDYINYFKRILDDFGTVFVIFLT